MAFERSWVQIPLGPLDTQKDDTILDTWARSSIGRAPDLHSGGCGFKSHRGPLDKLT